MFDTIKHGVKKVVKTVKDIFYNVPDGLMFVLQSSVITIFWITVIC